MASSTLAAPPFYECSHRQNPSGRGGVSATKMGRMWLDIWHLFDLSRLENDRDHRQCQKMSYSELSLLFIKNERALVGVKLLRS